MPLNPNHRKRGWPTGIVVIFIAAIFLELLMGIQYRNARALLEKELEHSTIMDLSNSSLRIREVLSKAEVAVHNEVIHAEKHLDDPKYLETILYSMVQNDEDNLDGAFMAFVPHFFPSKGYWYEPYVRASEEGMELIQIGSREHDYTKRVYYQPVIKDGVSVWSDPYWDNDGARAQVLTYATPILDKNGQPVGAIGVDLTAAWINDVINTYHPHPSSFSMVLSEDGETLISAPNDTMASALLIKQIVTMWNDTTVPRDVVGNGRITHFKFYDEEYDEYGSVYYARRRQSPNWQMLLVCYDSEVFGELDKLRRYMFIFALLGVAILTIIVWLFFRANRKLQITQLNEERISTELRVASEIQQSMLPHHKLSLDDVDIYGQLVPAREVGGDLYDYFIRDEKLFFCIGDVSGKGAPSAMLMAVVHSLFRSASAHETNPARIMQTVNEASAEGNDQNMFVTLFIGVLDLPTGHLRYCNAGHDAPFLLNDKNVRQLDCDANLPVGVFDTTSYSLQTTNIPAGSILFLYTDGLTEAKNKQREMYGMARVEDAMRACVRDALQPKQIIEAVTGSVHRFVRDAEQSDDLTMLAVHYLPSRFNSTQTGTLVLKNDVHEVKRLSAFIKDISLQMHLEPAFSNQLRLAIEEAVVNGIEYAYPVGTEGEIELLVESDGKTLRVIISDSGVPFDPTAKEKTDTTLSAEERQIGGLGILLVRELMDRINYERTDGKNVLTLTKKINQ